MEEWKVKMYCKTNFSLCYCTENTVEASSKESAKILAGILTQEELMQDCDSIIDVISVTVEKN